MKFLKYIAATLLVVCLIGIASAADLSGSGSGANFALMHTSGQIIYNDTIDGYNSSSLTFVDGSALTATFVGPTATQVQWGTGANASTSDVLMTYGKNTTNILKGTIKLKSYHNISWQITLDPGEQIIPYEGGFRITGTGVAQESLINNPMNGGIPAGIQIPAPTANDGNASVNVWYSLSGNTIALNIGNETNDAPVRYDMGGLVIDPSYYLSQYSTYLQTYLGFNGTLASTGAYSGGWSNSGSTYNTATPLFGNASLETGSGSNGVYSTSGSADFIPPSGGAWTLSYWINASSLSTSGNYAIGPGTANGSTFALIGFLVTTISQKLAFQASTGSAFFIELTSSEIIYPNIKNQIVVEIYPNDTVNMYLNGTLVATGTGSGSVSSSPNTLYIPSYDSSAFVSPNAEFDEVGIWQANIPIAQLWPQTQEMGSPALPVSITSNVTSGSAPFAVQLNDTSSWPSTSLTYANWSIYNITASNQKWVNLTVSGMNENITQTLSTAGTYNVSLMLTNNALLSNQSSNTTITVFSGTPVSSFTANQTTYTDYPMSVQFTDTSSNSPAAWNWSFGDGYTSTSQNPLHVYTVANNYTVTMNASNSNGVGANVIGYINLTSDVDSNVISWMHFNLSTTIDQQGNSWVASGNPAINAVTYKFGGGSINFPNPPPNNYISSASSVIWNLGSPSQSDELEFWIYVTSVGGAGRTLISRETGTANTNGWGFINGGSTSTYGFYMGSTANETPTFTIANGGWHHIVISLNSTYITTYEDGSVVSQGARPSGSYDTTNPIIIGNNQPNSPVWYMDEFRMSTSTPRFTMPSFSPPYAQYNGNLFYVYPNINSNLTLMYKSWPNNASAIVNITTPHVRTLQVQNLTNATVINANITFPQQFENVIGNPVINSTALVTYPDLQITSISVDNTNGIVSFSVSRSGGGGFQSLFLNRTSIVDTTFNYYNYSTQQALTTGFSNAYVVDGQHSVTYPITLYDTNYIPLGTWTIYPNITSNATTAAVGSSIQFTDQSLGEPAGWTNFSWAFGDGGTSNIQNPSYAYSAIGNYTVTYTSSLVANASVTNTTIMYENITAAPAPAPVASFTANPVMASVGSPVYFADTSINSPTSWSWTFGDSSGSNLQNPSHIYTLAGNYNVSLTASNSNGSNTTTKTNYINVTVYSGGYTRQDFTMAPKYTLQVTFTDSSTNNVIPVVSVSDNLGNNATTTNGVYTGTYPYSVVVIYASSSGYNSASQSYVVSGNLAETMQLTKTSSTSNSVLNLLYPQQVQFQILDAYGNYLTGTSVTATMINSVNNNTNWFSTLFGISSSATPLNSTVMYATTDSMGIVSFPMIQSAEYQLTFVNINLGVNAVKTVSPLQNNYMWILPDSLTAPITQQANVLKYSLPIYPPASAYPATVYLMGNYSDSLTETNYVNFYFTDYFGNLLYNLTINNPTGNVSAQYAVANVQGNQYRWGLNASTQEFGFVEQDGGIMLQGNSANGTSGNLFNKSCNDWACNTAGYGY